MKRNVSRNEWDKKLMRSGLHVQQETLFSATGFTSLGTCSPMLNPLWDAVQPYKAGFFKGRSDVKHYPAISCKVRRPTFSRGLLPQALSVSGPVGWEKHVACEHMPAQSVLQWTYMHRTLALSHMSWSTQISRPPIFRSPIYITGVYISSCHFLAKILFLSKSSKRYFT